MRISSVSLKRDAGPNIVKNIGGFIYHNRERALILIALPVVGLIYSLVMGLEYIDDWVHPYILFIIIVGLILAPFIDIRIHFGSFIDTNIDDNDYTLEHIVERILNNNLEDDVDKYLWPVFKNFEQPRLLQSLIISKSKKQDYQDSKARLLRRTDRVGEIFRQSYLRWKEQC